MKILELFSGTQSISSVFKANGWETFTIEKDSSFEDITTWTVDILEATAADILEKFGRPDVIWASPPCESFSVAAIGRNWTKLRKRRSRTEARASRAGLKAIQQNTRANRRTTANVLLYGESTSHDAKMPQVQGMPMYTVTKCQTSDRCVRTAHLVKKQHREVAKEAYRDRKMRGNVHAFQSGYANTSTNYVKKI
ncbi:hypothetical protein [Bacillus thuringiensis]|uniref:hypothetical protein n=1 Tax=Bacillus thuringiensis TaxID=1428 RepID=UPI0020C7A366|nr:hypothetical protein [Bacillus thuringiensis]